MRGPRIGPRAECAFVRRPSRRGSEASIQPRSVCETWRNDAGDSTLRRRNANRALARSRRMPQI
eukprot:11194772-Lingulodinium_polyedra.AAC.1